MDKEKAERLKIEYWNDVCKILDEKIQAVYDKVLYCSLDDLRGLQERIRTLQEIKGIPDDVIERQSPQ